MRRFWTALTIVVSCSALPAQGWQELRGKGHVLEQHQKKVGALGFAVQWDGWPRLFKAAVPYYSTGEAGGSGKLPPPMDLGAIMTAGKAGPTRTLRKDWAHRVFAASDDLKLYVSRLTPALVVEVTAEDVVLLGGKSSNRPRFLATRDRVFGPDGSPAIELKGPGWALVWYGKESKFRSTRFPYTYDGRHWVPGPAATVDCPVLLVFADPGVRLQVSEAGLTARLDASPDKPARVAMLPLRGDLFPPAGRTEAWAAGLPEEVAAQCQWWFDHLAEAPLTADETYSYDESTDTVTLATKVTFLKLREGGTRLAPLPPMLALARKHGLAMELSGPVIRTSVLTAIGPYEGIEGVESYKVRLRGLGKYVRNVPAAGSEAKEPPELNRALREQISKVVSAGHLAPWYPAVNVYGAGYRTYLTLGGTLEWANPGQTLFLLGEALPLLEGQERQDLLGYLRSERNDYPPERTAVLPAEQGARRERWRLDRAEIEEILLEHNALVKQRNFYVANRLVPEENLYYLAEYARRTGLEPTAETWPNIRTVLYPYLRCQDWATLGWYRRPGSRAMWNGHGGIIDANRHFAALVGALRLARWAGDKDSQPYLWGQFARAAILRYAMGRYADYLYDSRMIILPTDESMTLEQYLAYTGEQAGQGKIKALWGRRDWMARFFSGSWTGRLVTYDFTGAADDMRSMVRLNEFGVYFDEVSDQYHGRGNLLAYRGMVPELARFLADHEQAKARAFVGRVAEHMPDWYLALSQSDLGAEHNYLHPDVSYQCFTARAWILGEPAEKLRAYLDVPWMERGDLYYIHKLSETIKAYRGVTWRAVE